MSREFLNRVDFKDVELKQGTDSGQKKKKAPLTSNLVFQNFCKLFYTLVVISFIAIIARYGFVSSISFSRGEPGMTMEKFTDMVKEK